jgi:hypothetical protein
LHEAIVLIQNCLQLPRTFTTAGMLQSEAIAISFIVDPPLWIMAGQPLERSEA